MPLSRIRIATLLFGAVWLAMPASASVIATATAAAAPNGAFPPITNSASATATGGFAAVARVSGDDHAHFNINSAAIYDDATCIFSPCTWMVDRRATGSGLLGLARTSAAIGILGSPGGDASGQVILTDTITFSSASAGINLDTFYELLGAGLPIHPTFGYTSAASLQVTLQLTDPNDDFVYEYAIEFFDTVTSGPVTLFQDRHYVTTEGSSAAGDQIDTFTSFPTNDGQYHHSAALDVSAYIGVPLSLRFTVTAAAQCEFAALPGIMCTSIADSWDTAYLGVNGQYTSANGYSYPGLAPSSVPEPGTYSLFGPGIDRGPGVAPPARRNSGGITS